MHNTCLANAMVCKRERRIRCPVVVPGLIDKRHFYATMQVDDIHAWRVD